MPASCVRRGARARGHPVGDAAGPSRQPAADRRARSRTARRSRRSTPAGYGARWSSLRLRVTVVLLVGAGLLARSFAGLQRVDPGFDPENLLVLRIAPDVTRYREAPLDGRLLPPRVRLARRGARRGVGRGGHGPADEHDRLGLLSAVLAGGRPARRHRAAAKPTFAWRRRATSARWAFRWWPAASSRPG